jgi:hypothetical protein
MIEYESTEGSVESPSNREQERRWTVTCSCFAFATLTESRPELDASARVLSGCPQSHPN